MARRIPCPWPLYAGAWLDLPDEWLGKHALAYDEALDKAREAGLSRIATNFALSLALLDNWELPGIGGNPDGWQFAELPLPLIGWIIAAVLEDYNQCWQVPKNSYRPSQTGAAANESADPEPGEMATGQ
jgi:hypothetical protein